MENVKQMFKEIADFFKKKFDVVIGQNETIIERLKSLESKGSFMTASRPHTDAEILAIVRPHIPTQGKAPTKQELLAIIRPLIPIVKDGETPSDARLLRLIKQVLPKNEKVTLDTGEQIIDKINKDKSKEVIRKEKVEGWEEMESRVRTAEANSGWRGGGSFVYDYDLSSLLDGSTKTFSLPVNARVILVTGSSTPGIFRKTVDYTTTNGSITFTSQIDETQALATGQTLVVLYKIL